MQLSLWIPITVALGLFTHLALFAFIKICDEV